jgi:hypothetical protein
MSLNTRVMDADLDRVWEVLSDGWLYPLWVVGASRMREVDDTWPEVGSQLHHSAGAWPLLLDDTTEVLECAPRSRLVLKARGWPMGAARVTLRLSARGFRTEVVIEERAVEGPGALVPSFLQDPPLAWRNMEALRRLAFIVENRP